MHRYTRSQETWMLFSFRDYFSNYIRTHKHDNKSHASQHELHTRQADIHCSSLFSWRPYAPSHAHLLLAYALATLPILLPSLPCTLSLSLSAAAMIHVVSPSVRVSVWTKRRVQQEQCSQTTVTPSNDAQHSEIQPAHTCSSRLVRCRSAYALEHVITG